MKLPRPGATRGRQDMPALPASSPTAAQLGEAGRMFLHALARDENVGMDAWLSGHAVDGALLDGLEANRLAPFAFAQLRVAGLLGRLPEVAQEALRASYDTAAAASLMQTWELGELLGRLAAAGVEPLVLKGMALGATVYPAPGTRPATDIDLLVRREQIPTVHAVLLEQGYQDLDPDRQAGYTNHMHAWRALPSGLALPVEAHWRLVHEPGYATSIETEVLRARARKTDFGRFTARTLDPLDQLLHACVHLLLHHAWNWDLLWLLDLRLLVEHQGLTWNWQEAVARAEEMGLAEVLGRWLAVSEHWFGPFLTPEARIALAAANATLEERRHLAVAGRPVRVWRVQWQRAQGVGSFAGSAAYLARRLFPPWAYMTGRYGARSRWIAPAYYGWRLARAFRRKSAPR